MEKAFQRKVLAAFIEGQCPLPPADLFDPPVLSHLAEAAQTVLEAGASAVTWESLSEAATETPPPGVAARDIRKELHRSKKVADAPDVPYVVKKVSEVVSLARLQRHLPLAMEAARAGDLATASRVLQDAMRAEGSRSTEGSTHFLRRLGRTMLSDPAEQGNRISTGLACLDRRMGGGLGGGELGVVVAPPSRGKSTALIHLGAAALLWGYRVGHVSLEMSAAKIERRYMCNLAGLTLKEVKRSPYQAGKKVRTRMGDSPGTLTVKAFPPRSVSVRDIAAVVEEVDILLVDYGDLLRSSRQYDQRRFEIATCYEELRGFGVRENIPVWTASQTNRAAVNKKTGEIDMSDLAECFEKAAVADFMFSINMDEMDYQDGIARFFLMKNRDEEAMVAEKVYVDWASYQVSDKPLVGEEEE